MPLGRICRLAGSRICTSCPRTCALDNQRRAEKSRDHGVTRSRWTRWLRNAALQRDNYECQFKLAGCTGKATTVHLRAELEGDHDRATLDDCTSACAHCHGVVDGARARRRR